MAITDNAPRRLLPMQRRAAKVINRRLGPEARREYRQSILNNGPTRRSASGPGQHNRPFERYRLPEGTKGPLNAQYSSNLDAAYDTARFNRVNEQNAYGSRNYNLDPSTGQYTIQDTLAPGQQGILDQSWANTQRLVGQAANMPQMDMGASANLRQRYENELMGRFDRLNQTQFGRQDENFRQRMADQGIAEGSPQWAERYKLEIQQPQMLARQEAQSNAVMQGGQEQVNAFGMDYQKQMMPYQQAQYSQGIAGSVQQPNFQQMGQAQVGPVDVTGTATTWGQAGLQRDWQAQQNELERRNRLQAAQIAASAGGGEGGGDPGPMA